MSKKKKKSAQNDQDRHNEQSSKGWVVSIARLRRVLGLLTRVQFSKIDFTKSRRKL